MPKLPLVPEAMGHTPADDARRVTLTRPARHSHRERSLLDMPKLPKLKDRIRSALADGQMTYADLAYRVFPEEYFPNAFRYQRNGGPPGCYMALSRALREMKDEASDHQTDVGPGNRHVCLIG
jgi:hypothetical protein